MIRLLLAAFLLPMGVCSARGETDKPLLLQQPTLSATQIAFVYADHLWVVNRKGGEARRLTTESGRETDPVFSPDGTLIAFTGDYSGNADVYLIAATGGVPRRLTYHPGHDRVVGWTSDGKQVLFASPRNSPVGYDRFDRLFTIPLDSVLPTELPLPIAGEGSFSPDQSRLAYRPYGRPRENGILLACKRYRGGMTARIWLARLADSSIEEIPRENSNDFNPMWVGQQVYFLSDRNGPVTLFVYDTATKRVRQVLENKGLDIKSALVGPGAIVYEQFGSIHLFDLASSKEHKVNIHVKGEFPEVQPQFRKVASLIRRSRLSPTGNHAVFEARGDILAVSAESGEIRDLTNTPGAAERDPAWSPNGRWIAYFSDESGEYALHVRDQSGAGDVRKVHLLHASYSWYAPDADALVWSPDSKKITYVDNRLHRWYVDLDRGGNSQPPKLIRVDADKYPSCSSRAGWSPDSRWLVYTKEVENRRRAVFVHGLATGKTYQLTDGMTDADFPRFDKSGKYLYFTANTDVRTELVGCEARHRIYAILLRKDLPSPVALTSDGEKESRLPREPVAEAIGSGKKEGESLLTRIDLENIDRRILPLPISDREYIGMEAGKPGTLFFFASEPHPGSGPREQNLYWFDLATRKTEKLLEGVSQFALSENGEKILYRQGDRWAVVASNRPPKPDEGTLKLDAMKVWVDPRAEWRQIYGEAWRNYRDWFYDRGYHGLDIKAVRKKYEAYLDELASREDLNYLLAEMLGELSASHIFVGGGDQPKVNRVPIGLLGADYRIENGRYRITRLYHGDTWNPDLRGPLTEPGTSVEAGEYLLAVNGRELRASDNVYHLFEDTVGKPVRLRVGPKPDGTGAREVTVVPIESEAELHAFAWAEENRRKADQMSGGRVAYVYMPNVATDGFASFNRYYFGQVDKEGLVIDIRFNSGGGGGNIILDHLRRPLLYFTAMQFGADWPNPTEIRGPKAMIINEYAWSEGDQLPWRFRRSGLGVLIGKRTWGMGTGPGGGPPPLIDGGRAGGGWGVPNMAIYSPEGKWEIEQRGAEPDIELDFDPQSWRACRDPQLEKAVEWVLTELKKHPLPQPKRPPSPNYVHPSRMNR